MKIGLDIATLSIKKQIEKIILITADSDFIPAINIQEKKGYCSVISHESSKFSNQKRFIRAYRYSLISL
nr:NYN domain-containing protein [Campylobacter armoricus]